MPDLIPSILAGLGTAVTVNAIIYGWQFWRFRRVARETEAQLTSWAQGVKAQVDTALRTAELATPQPEWQADLIDPWEPPIVYAIPGAPVCGRRVCRRNDPEGTIWLREPSGLFIVDSDPEGMLVEDVPATWDWVELLVDFGPLELVPLTPEERATEALYGPIGARWGDPNIPCPYVGCRLGVRHAGDHKDAAGKTLGATLYATETDPTGAAVRRGYASTGEDACSCGHPEQHQPGCPRYIRTTGAPFTPTDGAQPPF